MDTTTSTRFLDSRRTALAAVMSLVAILLLAMYVAAPGNGNISFAAGYKAGGNLINGVVTDEDGSAISDASVKLTFTAAGKTLKSVTAKIGSDGRFTTRAPKGATGVKVDASKGSRKGSKRYALKRKKALKVQIKVPKRGGLFVNLIPAFPF